MLHQPLGKLLRWAVFFGIFQPALAQRAQNNVEKALVDIVARGEAEIRTWTEQTRVAQSDPVGLFNDYMQWAFPTPGQIRCTSSGCSIPPLEKLVDLSTLRSSSIDYPGRRTGAILIDRRFALQAVLTQAAESAAPQVKARCPELGRHFLHNERNSHGG